MRNVKGNMSAFALALALAASGAAGATFTVTSLADGAAPGPAGSLRKAVSDANGSAGADTIVFQTGLSGTITLTSGTLTLTQPVTITGSGMSLVTVSGNNAVRVFNVNSGVTASISDLTITQGRATNLSGGGIENSGNLTLMRIAVTNCVSTGDSSSFSGSGAGITNRTTLTMTDCTVSNNQSQYEGAGIANIVSANLTATNCTITGNISAWDGGGLLNRTSSATLTNCTISANQSMRQPDFGVSGGGVLTLGLSGGNASLTMLNCTVTGNAVAGTGAGGIQVFSNNAISTLTIRNTLVAANTCSVGTRNFIIQHQGTTGSSTISSGGHNLDSDGTSGLVNGAAGNIVGTVNAPVNALLGPLTDNGGPTWTHLPQPGSPAIDTGDPVTYPPTDQRGAARPSDGNGDAIIVPDIGAVEVVLLPDCNHNGLLDSIDIANSTSTDCEGNGVPDECEIAAGHVILSQWATRVIAFSSQYSSTDWSAAQVIGPPNTFSYGDIGTSWAPAQPNGSLEDITVGYANPVHADGVTIRETLANGMVYRIDLLDTQNQFHTIWTGVDPSQNGTPVDFQVNWPPTAYLVKGVKVYINMDHDPDWEEIDAIQLRGSAPVYDCNANNLPDTCEVASGSSSDCNANGVPDECDLSTATSQDCDGNGVPDECEIAAGEMVLSQWGAQVIGFSSQYSNGGWSAAQATGAPNTFVYGDVATAWAPSQPNGSLEFITLSFATPVFADGVTVRETFGNGMVYQIDLLDTQNLLHTIWTGVDPSPDDIPVDFQLNWPRTAYRVKGVKIYVNTDPDPNWEEIDAVQLHGVLTVTDCDSNGIPDHCEPDADLDLSIDACDLCPNTIPGVSVDANGCPPLIPGDFDRDGDVDATDVDDFITCATRDRVPGSPPCMPKDLDIDGDIDMNDFAIIQRCYTGPNNPGNPNCAD